jgi:diacylglycerol kinase (ATP)
LVTIANLKGWGAGVIISPNAEPDDGLLDICILHRVKFFYALFHFPKLFTGKIDKIRKYDRYQTKKLQIIREKPGPFHVDGESHDAGLILDISVDSKALKIIVP